MSYYLDESIRDLEALLASLKFMRDSLATDGKELERAVGINDLEINARTYNALIWGFGDGSYAKSELLTIDFILESSVWRLKNFGAKSFTDLVGALKKAGVPTAKIESSIMWRGANEGWRKYAAVHT